MPLICVVYVTGYAPHAMRALLLLGTLLLGALGGWAQPFDCAPGCTDRGNCNPDTGDCICPYGYTGKACEVDALSACRLAPDSPANCEWQYTTSCECWRQCKQYHCRNGLCDWYGPPPNQGCFMREGVEQQSAAPPEEGEKAAYYLGWMEGAAQTTDPSEIEEKVMREGHSRTLPLSRCQDRCNQRGHCYAFVDAPDRPICACLRGYFGSPTCDKEEEMCYLNCNGHGKCHDMYCHCEPPYFSIGCSRHRAVPHTSQPSAVRFKIYMYELPTQVAYHIGSFRDMEGSGLYAAYMQFLEQFLLSPVRTEDPSEANMFFVPALNFAYSRPNNDADDHLNMVLDYVATRYPYFNRTGGTDHFVWVPADRGGCHLTKLAKQVVKLTHFGYYFAGDLKESLFETVRGRGSGKGYGCYHPLRDVVTVPTDTRHEKWAETSNKMSVDEIIASKKKLLFFCGGGVDGDYLKAPEFSGFARQELNKHIKAWDDPDFVWMDTVKGEVVEDYEAGFRDAKYCFAPYGWGWGIRLPQAVVANCIPVIVQERVFQAYEDLLPYESFSIRLTVPELGQLRDILHNITDAQYRGMVEALVQYRAAFHWYPQQGGRAFDYTIASLRRRHFNSKAPYWDATT